MTSSRISSASTTKALEKLDVVVLAGGLGTRIKGVLGDVPKVLAPINGRPFLDYLLDWLGTFGARRIVLCLGHLADKVTMHLQHRTANGMTIIPVIEPSPLGTAGALRLARPHLQSDPVLVMNGDTFIDADLAAFATRHSSSHADVSLLCTEVGSAARFGSIELDARGYIRRFSEKNPTSAQPGIISAGIYLFSAASLEDIARRTGPSLERDYLQTLAPGTIRGDMVRARFTDIGTPESLAEAVSVILGVLATRKP